jgi:iron complex outermembrane receptor protein
VARLRTNFINGSNQKTSGIDVLATYSLPEPVAGVDISVGGSLSYVLEFKVDAQTVEGFLAAPAYNGVNKLNQGQSIVPVPDWKAQVYTEFTRGPHNLRITGNYISSYVDQRLAPYLPQATLGPPGAPKALLRGSKIKENLIIDAAYRVELPWDTTLSVRVQNVFDKDPSPVR